MKVSTERLENSEILLTIEVDEDRVDTAMRGAARRISQQTNIPGFRRGKAPYSIVLQRFGRAAILEEAVDDLGQEVYKEALEEAKIEPFAQAKLEDVQFDPLVLKMKVPVAPEVDLGDYRSLRLDVPVVEVTDEEVDQSIEAMRERNITWAPVEREAKWDDRLTVRVTQDDGEPGEPQDIVLQESSRYPAPGFGEKLLGAKAGETRAFEITFPEDWHTEAERGQTRTYNVEIQEVKEKELPPLDDLPALIGDYEDLDALKESVRQDLQAEKEAERDEELRKKGLEILVEQAKIEYPQALLEEELDALLERQDAALKRQGLSLEAYLKAAKLDHEEYRQQMRPQAEEQMKRSLVLSRLMESERLRAEAEEIQGEIEARAGAYEEHSERMRDVLTSPAGLRFVASEILSEKALGRLLQIVKGEAPDLPAEEEGAAEEGAEADEEAQPEGASEASEGEANDTESAPEAPETPAS